MGDRLHYLLLGVDPCIYRPVPDLASVHWDIHPRSTSKSTVFSAELHAHGCHGGEEHRNCALCCQIPQTQYFHQRALCRDFPGARLLGLSLSPHDAFHGALASADVRHSDLVLLVPRDVSRTLLSAHPDQEQVLPSGVGRHLLALFRPPTGPLDRAGRGLPMGVQVYTIYGNLSPRPQEVGAAVALQKLPQPPQLPGLLQQPRE